MNLDIPKVIASADQQTYIHSVTEIFGSDEAREQGWHLVTSSEWLFVENCYALERSQGWKLHISATVRNANIVLERVLPLLKAKRVCFKTVASIQQLYNLNRGACGRSQVGKFITVYPGCDEQAVRLAADLNQLLAGLAGPRIPTDRPLSDESIVYYRYGAFTGRYIQTPVGEILPAIQTPDGSFEPDVRRSHYHAYPWTNDPFVVAGVVARQKAKSLRVGQRYLIVAVKSRAFRTTVYLAIDTISGEPCILKQAHHDSGFDLVTGPIERLHHEIEMLKFLSEELPVPTVRDVLREGKDLILVMDYLDGVTLEEHINTLAAQGRFLQFDEIIKWGQRLIEFIQDLHERNLIYGDLKPSNIILNLEQETLRLIDFEVTDRLENCNSFESMGTPGYTSPERVTDEKLTKADDIFAFGAVLYFMTTAADPSLAPDPLYVMARPPETINPSLAPDLSRLIAYCLQSSPSDRPPSAEVVLRELANARSADSPT